MILEQKVLKKKEVFQLKSEHVLPKETITPEQMFLHFQKELLAANVELNKTKEENVKLKKLLQNADLSNKYQDEVSVAKLKAYDTIMTIVSCTSKRVLDVEDTRTVIFKAGKSEFETTKYLENMWKKITNFSASASTLLRIFRIDLEKSCLFRKIDRLVKVEKEVADAFVELLCEKHQLDASTVKTKILTKGTNIRSKKVVNPLSLDSEDSEISSDNEIDVKTTK
eukprot:gene9677-1883_t